MVIPCGNPLVGPPDSGATGVAQVDTQGTRDPLITVRTGPVVRPTWTPTSPDGPEGAPTPQIHESTGNG